MQRIVKVHINNSVLDARVEHLERGPPVGCGLQDISVRTDRGEVHGQLYSRRRTGRGMVIITGSEDFGSPAGGLFTNLSRALMVQGVCSLIVQCRHPKDLHESVLDAVIGTSYLRSEGLKKIVIIGYSLWGAVALHAASNDASVCGVVALAMSKIDSIPTRTRGSAPSLLFVHGREDEVMPVSNSVSAFLSAEEPKKLVLLSGAKHHLDEAAQEVYTETASWVISSLR